MHLSRSPLKQYVNAANTTFKAKAFKNDHIILFKDLVDCYECWILLPDNCLYDTLVY